MGNNKPRIAVIGLKGLPAFGGAAAVGENLINQLKHKYEFTIYSISSHTEHKTGAIDGFHQIVFRKIPFKKLNTLYYYILSTVHVFLFGKYDLVHLHHRDAAFIIKILKIRFKTIITTHNSFFVRNKWKNFKWFFEMNERYFVKFADVRTCVSLQEKRDFKQIGIDMNYIPNGISTHYKTIRINNDYSPTDINIFFGAGRIIKTKGLDILLKAMKLIDKNIKLVIAGDLNQTPRYKREILELSKNQNVTFLGLVKNKNLLLGYVRAADLFVFPSSYEAMSMMLLEAISTKCPAIVSDIQQNRDILTQDEVLFFRKNDHFDLAEKIIFSIENPEIMKRKAQEAYNRCLLDYNWENISKKYDSHYKSLI